MFRTMFSPIIRNTWLYLQYLVVFTQVAAGWQPAATWVNTSTRWGGWLTPRPGRFSPEMARFPVYGRTGRPQGPVWAGAKNLAPTGIRSSDRPARSWSLHWLRYSGPPDAVLAFKISKIYFFVRHPLHVTVHYKWRQRILNWIHWSWFVLVYSHTVEICYDVTKGNFMFMGPCIVNHYQ